MVNHLFNSYNGKLLGAIIGTGEKDGQRIHHVELDNGELLWVYEDQAEDFIDERLHNHSVNYQVQIP